MGLFIRKSIEALQAEAKETGSGTLKRVLGPVSLVALGVGVIIGAGLFSITGTVAASYTGPAITLSFIIAAIGCCFAVPFPIHPGSIMVENKPHTTEGNKPLCIFFIMFRRFSQKNDFSVYKYSITSRIAM